ncbi:MAG: hypothetical protein JKX97_03005 [Candidatus Lindowbacteria bacterium]|nr:hypothetical protein [Candidatus Lindowbacteria bacterium]
MVVILVQSSAADVTTWIEAAETWETTALKMRKNAKPIEERAAWKAAAQAWTKVGELRLDEVSNLESGRIDQLESAVELLASELKIWRSAARDWREVEIISGILYDKKGEAAAKKENNFVFSRIVEFEQKLDLLAGELNKRRTTLLGKKVSPELQTELVERWAEVATSWESTALTWERTGESEKANTARGKAEIMRNRIRELRPDLKLDWFLEFTYPPELVARAKAASSVISIGTAPEEPKNVVIQGKIVEPAPIEVTPEPEREPAIEVAPEPELEPAIEVAPEPEPEPIIEVVSEPEPEPVLQVDRQEETVSEPDIDIAALLDQVAMGISTEPVLGVAEPTKKVSPAPVERVKPKPETKKIEPKIETAPVVDEVVLDESAELPDSAQLVEADTRLKIPQIRPALVLPPLWLLEKEEQEQLEKASIFRSSAVAWRKTALGLMSDGSIEESEKVIANMEGALKRAETIENEMRYAYATREAEISKKVAPAFGEAPRSETEILRQLDAAGQVEDIPPALLGEAIALKAPALPKTETQKAKDRGFLDLEIGGPIPSTLSIRGRKTVDVNFSTTHFPNPSATRVGGTTQSNFTLNQELQVSVTGVVGKPDKDHINVNIQFDDTQRGVNSVNNRVINVDYTTVPRKASWGTWHFDPRFGDISVALPGSEFAFYNKSLFGVKGDLKIDNLNIGPIKARHVNAIIFGSQTKGVSASKEFSLSGERIIQDIQDVDFSRNRFFLIEPNPAELAINGVQVYLDNSRGGTQDIGKTEFIAVGAGAAAGFGHNGKWKQLTAGIDYTLNQITGELEMLIGISDNDYISVAYNSQLTNYEVGAANLPRLIRVSTSDSSTVRTAMRPHQFRNHYLLQRSRIKKNDPDFVFEIRDELGFTQTDLVNGIPTTYLQLFGFDRDRDDIVDIEVIDYDFGVIRPVDSAPFNITGNAEIDNSQLYTKTDVTEADQKYTIHIEYSSDQPQEIFSLGFDILKGSDIVYVDGVEAKRNIDYFIDYEAGIISFLNKAILQPNSTIRVDYEFLPFGGQFERTLAGGRIGVDVDDALGFGTTLLYDFSTPANEVPSIFEDVPNQNVVAEFDARANITTYMKRLLGGDKKDPKSSLMKAVKDKFRLNVSGEWAWASQDPNTFGTAMIEDFEDVENIVSASFNEFAWAPASKSVILGLPEAARGTIEFSEKDNFGHLSQGQISGSDEQNSLQLGVKFAAGDTWISIRQPLSAGAINFEDLTTMELFTSGIPNDVQVIIDVGLVSEDADGDGILDSEDVGLDGLANTHDVGEDNSILNNGEDEGIDIGGITFGYHNAFLNTEDMNGNFILDQREAYFQFSDTSPDAETKAITGFENSNWEILRVPWVAGKAVGEADSSVIKHIRITFIRQPDRDTDFTIFMDQMSFRGNRFVGASNDSRLLIIARNTLGDPNYSSPPQDEINQGDDVEKEQALALVWNLAAGDSVTVKQKFTRCANLSDYNRLSYFVAGDARGETFSLFLVSDENNFIEIRKRITTGSNLSGGVAAPIWQKIDIPLEPIRSLTISNILGTSDTTLTIVGADYDIVIQSQALAGRAPSLANINEIWLRVASGDNDQGEFWINDLFAAEPQEKSGMARKASFSTGWGDLLGVSGSWKDVPGTFRGVGFINNPQNNTYDEVSQNSKSVSWNLQLHKLFPKSWNLALPLSGSWSKNSTTVDPNKVENTLKSNLGTSKSENQSYNTSIRIWKLPSVSLSYNQSTAAVDYRSEDRTSKTSNFSGSTGWGYSFPKKLFGIIPTGQSLSFNTSYGYALARANSLFSSLSGLSNTNSRVANQNMSFSVNAQPISRLNLSYSYNTGFLDRRTLIESQRWRGITNRSHSMSSSLNLPTVVGLSPGVNFSGNYSENFYRATFGGRSKDASLGGNFSMNVGIDPAKWSRLFSFLTARYNYSLSSNASYRQLNTGTAFGSFFGDYVGERLFPWGSAERIGTGTGDAAAFRTSGSTNITHNLSGNIKTWDWLNTSYSTNLSRNEVASLSTLAITDGLSANMNFRMDYNRAFPNSWIKFRSSYLTAAVSYGLTENAASENNSISPNVNWNAQWTDALNTTMSMSWNRSSSLTYNAPNDKSITTSLRPSMNFTYYFDLPIPESLAKTKLGKFAALQKRVSLSGGANAGFDRSERGGISNVDRNNYGTNLSLGYRVSSSIELTASSNASWLQDNLESQNDNIRVGGGAKAEWRF